MVLTEDEAKLRWCPEARVALDEGPAVNRGMGLIPEICCLGSGCMLWRWQSLSTGSGQQAMGFCSLSSHQRGD